MMSISILQNEQEDQVTSCSRSHGKQIAELEIQGLWL